LFGEWRLEQALIGSFEVPALFAQDSHQELKSLQACVL
jgi:hypothetical protein